MAAMIATAMAGVSAMAVAATPSQQTVGPGQVKRQIESMPTPPVAPRSVPLPQAAKTRVTMQARSFVLSGVLIEGSKVFENLDFLPFYKPYLGKKITVATLRKVAEAITGYYHQAGYFLSYTFLPAQRIEFGIVRIRVVEGYLADWKITGDANAHDPLIEKILRPLLAQRPLKRAALDAAFQKLAALPDMVFHPRLHPVQDHPGAYQLVLDTQQKLLGGGASFDNHGIQYLGPVQGMLTLQAFDLTGHHESYQLRFATTTHVSELRYYDLGTQWLLGVNGAQLQASAAHTTANPGGRLASLNAHIRNDHFRLGADYPLQRNRFHSTYLGLAATRDRSHTTLLTSDRIENMLTTLVLSLRHTTRYGSGVTHSAGLSLAKGLNVAGSEVVDTLAGTEAGKPNYFKLDLYYSYQRLVMDRIQLSAQLGGQYAATPLPALERFSLGGEKFGRAYDPSEIIGDSGLAGRVEVAYRQAVPAVHWHVSPYGFYDLGAVWQATSEPLVHSASLASCGIGLRAAGTHLSAYLEVDKPLTRRVASQGNKDPRLFGGIAFQF